MFTCRNAMLIPVLAFLLVGIPAAGQGGGVVGLDPPGKSTASSTGTAPANAVSSPVVPTGSKMSLAVPSVTQSYLCYAANNGPYLMLNGYVHHIPDGESVGQLPAKLQVVNRPQALTSDGKTFAVIEMGQAEIQIFDTAKGEKARTIALPFRPTSTENFLWFLDNTSLLWIGSGYGARNVSSSLSIWDVSTGKLVKEMKAQQRINAADVRVDGKVAAVLGDEKEIDFINLPAMTVSSRIMLRERRVCNFRISPDGTEVAATVSQKGGYFVVVWNLEGKTLFEAQSAQITGGRASSLDSIQFMPDKSGVLIDYRFMMDRRIGKNTWQIKPFSHAFPPVRFVNNEQVIAFESKARRYFLSTFDIPRSSIDGAVEMLKNPPADATLKPKDSVRLDIAIKNVRFGTNEEVQKDLTRTLTGRLAANEFSVDPKAALTLRVDYDEAADSKDTAVVQGGKTVGSTSQTVIRCQLKLLGKDGKQVLYDRSFDMKPWQYGTVSSTKAEDLRAAKLSVLQTELSRIDLPLLIYKDIRIPFLTTIPQD